MKIIGLTGGIASGKSTVSNIIEQLGIPVIDADKVAREIVQKGKPALKEIENVFGKEVVNEDGSLNRKLLGSIVFSDMNKLEKLNYIMHPRIIKEIINKIENYRMMKTHPIIVVDAALLIETNMRKLVDEVWLVVIDEKIQLHRLMQRDKITYEEAVCKIRAQMSMEEKMKFADVVIDNNYDLHYLKKQIKQQIGRIKKEVVGGI